MAARTNSGSARRTDAAPVRAATRLVSTRCAPLVRMSSGASSARKTRLLAIAPTSQPSCAAAVAAVGRRLGQLADLPGDPQGPERFRDADCAGMHASRLAVAPSGGARCFAEGSWTSGPEVRNRNSA